jgi:hypothetical protein
MGTPPLGKRTRLDHRQQNSITTWLFYLKPGVIARFTYQHAIETQITAKERIVCEMKMKNRDWITRSCDYPGRKVWHLACYE